MSPAFRIKQETYLILYSVAAKRTSFVYGTLCLRFSTYGRRKKIVSGAAKYPKVAKYVFRKSGGGGGGGGGGGNCRPAPSVPMALYDFSFILVIFFV